MKTALQGIGSVFALVVVLSAGVWAVAEFGWSFKQGTVVEKWFEPYREWDTQRQVCGTYDKNGQCTWWYFITEHHVDDEDWMVKVRGCQDNRPDKCKTEDWELAPADWERTQIGDVVAKP